MAGGHGHGGGLARVTSLFFDQHAVMSRVDAATRRALSRFGAYVRADAKRSIRKAGNSKPSAPGRPPKSRKGTLKQFITFSYDPTRRSVVIGPELLPRARKDNLIMLEHGGRRRMTLPSYGGAIRRLARYPARPFTQPAFEKNKPLAAVLYKDQVR